MNVTPFGAKSPSNTVVGVSADADGRLNTNTKKTWENVNQCILDLTEIPSGGSSPRFQNSSVFNAEEYALVSLRVRNDSDRAVTLRFFEDASGGSGAEYTAGTRYLRDLSGDPINIVLPPDTATATSEAPRFYLITPEDVPFLQYVKVLKVELEFQESLPTTLHKNGHVAIWVIGKK